MDKRGKPVFDTSNRVRIYEAVKASPGVGFRELVRTCELSVGTARHHLTVLVRHGVLVERRHGSRIVFFTAHAPQDGWRGVVALRNAGLRELHSVVLAAPGQPQAAVVRTMAGRGWRRTTTIHRLTRLERHGVLHSIRLQQTRHYWPTTAVQGPSPAAFEKALPEVA